MKNFFDIKKIIFCFIIIFWFPIIIIHILFKWENGPEWLVAKWEAGDVLNYTAAFMGTVSTIIFGVVTLKLSKQANDINERLLNIEYMRMQPRIDVQSEPYKIYFTDLERFRPHKMREYEKTKRIFGNIIIENKVRNIDVYNTLVAVMEFKIINIGESAITKIYVDNFSAYLSTESSKTPYNIRLNSENLMIEVGEIKTFTLLFNQEVHDESELINFNEEDRHLLPYLDFELTLITQNGLHFKEKMILSTNLYLIDNSIVRTFNSNIIVSKK